MSVTESKRTRLERLRAQLELERATFISHWRDLGDFILPRRPRFFISDVNRGDRRNQKIIDSTATLSARNLRSGMMGGVTSPARPWFRLTTPDPALADDGEVKQWLYIVSQRMIDVFLRSNLYNCLPTVYGDMGVFGTAAIYVEEDFDDVIRCYPFPIGSYCIANDHNLKVNTFYRDFRMTVGSLVEKFADMDDKGQVQDWSNFSLHARTQYEQGFTQQWIDVCHFILPNPDYDPKKIDSKHKKYLSTYYEKGTSSNNDSNYMSINGDLFLSEKGYDYFPVLAPRWELTGEDVYGTECPGMIALGDIKQLQAGEKRGAQAIEKKVNPPMTAPTSMRTQKTSLLPGDITYMDTREGQQGFRPAHEVNLSLVELENKQSMIRERIKRCFYEDLFLMLSSSDRREITAREVDERHEEKLLALGPVLEQLNQDLLDPLIDITFDIMMAQGRVPPPPKKLHGTQLKVEYISIMAQAQKAMGIEGIEKFTNFIGMVAQQDPSIKDKVNTDNLADVYGEMTSIPPNIIRSDEEVQQIRGQRNQQQAQAQKMQQIQQAAGAAKDLSSTELSGDNALSRLIDQGKAGSPI